jgi:hypothetical protein
MIIIQEALFIYFNTMSKELNFNLMVDEDKTDLKISQFPYVFELYNKGKTQQLTFFGTEHSSDVNNKQWKILERDWRKFVDNTQVEKRVVFLEGSPRVFSFEKYLDNNEKITGLEVVQKYGEFGAWSYFSQDDQKEVIFVDPKFNDEAEYLLRRFDKTAVSYYFFARYFGSYINKQNITFDEALKQAVITTHNKTHSSFSGSVEDYKKIHQQFFNHKLDEGQIEVVRKASWPTRYDCQSNEVARQSTVFRNIYILKQIKKYWEQGKNVFILFGAGHAVAQKPVLCDFIENQ